MECEKSEAHVCALRIKGIMGTKRFIDATNKQRSK